MIPKLLFEGVGGGMGVEESVLWINKIENKLFTKHFLKFVSYRSRIQQPVILGPEFRNNQLNRADVVEPFLLCVGSSWTWLQACMIRTGARIYRSSK